jgi:hypothetical protein
MERKNTPALRQQVEAERGRLEELQQVGILLEQSNLLLPSEAVEAQTGLTLALLWIEQSNQRPPDWFGLMRAWLFSQPSEAVSLWNIARLLGAAELALALRERSEALEAAFQGKGL